VNLVHFHYSWMIIMLPLAVWLFIWWSSRKEKQAMSALGNLTTLTPLINKSASLVTLKNGLFILALVSLSIAILRPQWGLRKEVITRKGLDIVIALDVSASMFAEDIQPNRLTKSIMEIRKILPKLGGDRVGLVTFSGSATRICPLTLDYGAIEMFLQAIRSYREATPGTNLYQAYHTAVNLFEQNVPRDKLILIFPDGENHEGNLPDIRQHSRNNGVIIIPIAVGSIAGQPIPDINAHGVRNGYKKDRQGNIVISHVDPESLKKIAAMGPYVIDTSEQTIHSIIDDIKHYKRSKLAELKVSIHTERYYIFLLIGLFLLCLSYGLKERS